jgi:hypothetical protein
MEEEIIILEEKVATISTNLLSSSSFIINDDITKIKKDYYKSLISALNIIRSQKQKIIDLQLTIIELEDECNKRDIMRFCS